MKLGKLAVATISILSLAAGGVGLLARSNAKELRRLSQRAGPSFVVPHKGPEREAAIADAIGYARAMAWKPYDPLMGRYGDPLGKIGFVVCIDVPLRSYQAAGVSLPALLRQAAKEHPEWFAIGPNNPPSSPFFFRRVRNYYDLFKNHPALRADSVPRPGDWAFYGKWHIALVVNVESDGRYEVIEASPRKGRVALSDSESMTRTWGVPHFFGRIQEK